MFIRVFVVYKDKKVFPAVVGEFYFRLFFSMQK